MADIDTVLERLVTDTGFRQRLAEDPAAALSSYELSTDDLQLLASSLDSGDDAQRGVEQRTSKSAVIGLLASLTGGGSGGVRPGVTNSGDDVVVSSSTKPFTATGTYSDGRTGVTNPIGVADPSPASKYTAPINVASGSATLRADGSGLPALDGASKDTGFLNQDAPSDDEALRKVPGRPKAGEITMTRSVAADYDGDGAADIKNQNPIGVDQLAPDGGAKAGAEDFNFNNIKLINARQQGDAIAPPGSEDAGAADFHTIKLTNDPGKDVGRASAPPGSVVDSGVEDFKLMNEGAVSSGPLTSSPPSGGDDFLRIEDE